MDGYRKLLMSDTPLLERPKQLAKRTGLSERQIRHLIETGQLRRVRVGCRDFIPVGEFEKFVAEGTQNSWEDGTKDHAFAISKSARPITSPGPSAVAAASAARARETARRLSSSLPNGYKSEGDATGQVIPLKPW